MSLRLAEAFSIIALVLLLIYGADAASKGANGGGFLPIDTMVRGIIFGGTAVALSTAAFFVSIGQRSLLVSALLIVNGILIAIGGAMALEAKSMNAASAGPYIVLGLGLWVISLGIVKTVRRGGARTTETVRTT